MSFAIHRRAFTLIELLVVIVILFVLAALFLPATRDSREASRRMACSSNIRSVAIAAYNYELTYRSLPGAGLGVYLAGRFERVATGSEGYWSGHAAILPYYEKNSIYDRIAGGYKRVDPLHPEVECGAWGFNPQPPPSNNETYLSPRSLYFLPARNQLPLLRCPSDPGRNGTNNLNALGRTNYAFCFGDTIRGVNSISTTQDHSRGAFALGRQYKIDEITDGTANTILFGEIATPEKNPNDNPVKLDNARVQGRVTAEVPWSNDPITGLDIVACRSTLRAGRYSGVNRIYSFRGIGWLDGRIAFTGFNTVLPPNSAACAPSGVGNESEGGVFSATSYHPGGAHVVFVDSKVRFITDDIDAGKVGPGYVAPARFELDGEWLQSENWSKPSPFGVWGALGTRAAEEVLSDLLD